jgi:hypothetical protein
MPNLNSTNSGKQPGKSTLKEDNCRTRRAEEQERDETEYRQYKSIESGKIASIECECRCVEYRGTCTDSRDEDGGEALEKANCRIWTASSQNGKERKE